MQQFASAEEILEFAIAKEREAQEFYRRMAGMAQGAGMSRMFEEFVAQEARHEAKLKGVRQGRKALVPGGKVPDLKIAEYTAPVEPGPDMDYQDALDVAMHREKAAFALYSDLAGATDDPELQELFSALAQEEAKHKLFLEREYDEHVLTDN
jgi:rubrerythrin